MYKSWNKIVSKFVEKLFKYRILFKDILTFLELYYRGAFNNHNGYKNKEGMGGVGCKPLPLNASHAHIIANKFKVSIAQKAWILTKKSWSHELRSLLQLKWWKWIFTLINYI